MKEISGFYKLWSDRGEVHLRLFSMPVKPFRHCFVFLPDSIVKSMSANSFCDVSFQHLKQGVFIIYDLFSDLFFENRLAHLRLDNIVLQKAAYLKRYRAGLVLVSGDFPWPLLQNDLRVYFLIQTSAESTCLNTTCIKPDFYRNDR